MSWDDLSMREKAAMMRVAVKNKIFDIDNIKKQYNSYAEGGNYTVGNLVDAIYQNNPKEEFLGTPSHNYDFTQSEEWANAHGYYPDAKGHRDDRVKKPAHPSHPSRGNWEGDNFILTDLGFEDPNYTLFGLNDGGQDPQATLIYNDGVVLPEITVTPKGNYIYNSYDNIKLHLKSNGGKINRFDEGGGTTQNKYPTYNDLINNPEYGLVQDTFNGKLIYRQPGDPEKAAWFYASRAEEVPNQTVDWPIMDPQKQADNYDAKWYNYNQPATMNYISSQIDNIANKVDSNKGFSFHAENPTLDTALSFAPFYGTLMDVEDAIKDPSLYNIGNAALGVITDLTGISLARSLAKSIKAASKAKKAASKHMIKQYIIKVSMETIKEEKR